MTPEDIQALKDEQFDDPAKAKPADSIPLSSLTEGVTYSEQETAMNIPGKVPEPSTEYQGHGMPVSVYDDTVEEDGRPAEDKPPSEGILDNG
jgi:hypothetical protein